MNTHTDSFLSLALIPSILGIALVLGVIFFILMLPLELLRWCFAPDEEYYGD